MSNTPTTGGAPARAPRLTRLYTIARRPRHAPKGTAWERVGEGAYPKATAVRVFQNTLLSNALGEYDATYEYRIVEAVRGNG